MTLKIKSGRQGEEKMKMGKRKNFTEKQKRNLINQLSQKYGLRCWYCGAELTEKYDTNKQPVVIDHIEPYSKIKSDDFYNLALSCSFCNRAKWDKSIDEFMGYLAHIRTGGFWCPILIDKPIRNKVVRDILQKSFR